jgi:signal transduction histidine kinase
MYHIGELWIQNEHEIQLARQWTQKLAYLVNLSVGNQARLTTAVSQITQSLHYYSRCVYVSYDIIEEGGKLWLQISLREAKTFVPSVEKQKEPTLSKEDFLKWLGSTRNLITRFSILAEEGKPIEVTLAKPFPVWKSQITEVETNKWNEALKSEMPRSLLEEILQQNQELVRVLDTLRENENALEQKITETQKLEKLRDELVHTLVHDLRNPLATIRSSLSGLLYNNIDNLSPYQFAMIEISYLGARKMTRLVNNILDMHKLEQEGLPLQPGSFSPSDLIQKVIKAQTPLAGEKNIRLTRRITRDIPWIDGDAQLIERVLQNLTDNALKFTPEGGQVLISAKRVAMDKKSTKKTNSLSREQFISFSVKDTGTGIPPEIEAKLFEKFTTGSQEESGSGLGLAFCQMAVQAHGGEIWARNNSGKGTTFTFILPISQKERI